MEEVVITTGRQEEVCQADYNRYDQEKRHIELQPYS